MAKRGRKKTISDVEMLRHFAHAPDPAFVATEFTDDFEMSRQGVLSRFDDLEDEGLLRSKMAGGRRIFWITRHGLEAVSQAERADDSDESSQ